jgi:hypothetical protein
MEGGGIWWQGASVAEKEVARGRSSRGLLMLRSFCSIVCSLVAGSSGSRALAGFFCTGDRERVLASRREARANTARFGQSDVCIPCVQQRQYGERDSIDVRLWSNIKGSFEQLDDIAFECISVVAFTNKQRWRRKKKARSFRLDSFLPSSAASTFQTSHLLAIILNALRRQGIPACTSASTSIVLHMHVFSHVE